MGCDGVMYEEGNEDRSVMYSLSLSLTVDVRGGCSREVH